MRKDRKKPRTVVSSHYDFEIQILQQWPPPELVKMLEPIRKTCQEKTGVSDGNATHENYFSILENKAN